MRNLLILIFFRLTSEKKKSKGRLGFPAFSLAGRRQSGAKDGGTIHHRSGAHPDISHSFCPLYTTNRGITELQYTQRGTIHRTPTTCIYSFHLSGKCLEREPVRFDVFGIFACVVSRLE